MGDGKFLFNKCFGRYLGENNENNVNKDEIEEYTYKPIYLMLKAK